MKGRGDAIPCVSMCGDMEAKCPYKINRMSALLTVHGRERVVLTVNLHHVCVVGWGGGGGGPCCGTSLPGATGRSAGVGGGRDRREQRKRRKKERKKGGGHTAP